MFEDHRFDRLLANYKNGLITLEEYGKAYHYLVGTKISL